MANRKNPTAQDLRNLLASLPDEECRLLTAKDAWEIMEAMPDNEREMVKQWLIAGERHFSEYCRTQTKIYAEHATEAFAKGRQSRNPPERYPDRNAEVIRLHEAGLSPSRIATEIRKTEAWRLTERGTLFKAANVKSILQQARDAGRVARE